MHTATVAAARWAAQPRPRRPILPPPRRGADAADAAATAAAAAASRPVITTQPQTGVVAGVGERVTLAIAVAPPARPPSHGSGA